MKIDEIIKKSSEYFNLEEITPEYLLPLFQRLHELNYTEENVFKALDVPDIDFIAFKYLPIYLYKIKEKTPLHSLIKLFLLSCPISEEEYQELFSSQIREICEKTGLIAAKNKKIDSPVNLIPCLGMFFASDPMFSNLFTKKHIYPPGKDSFNLARGMIDVQCDSLLDLCTGSGIQAVLASRFAKKVTGIDINPRAVNFSRFNAMLNQRENVSFLLGDLYKPIAGEKFDRITANPPFVPSPAERVFFRDGSSTGESILERIVSELPQFLAPEGKAQIVTLLVFNEGEEYIEKLRRWMGSNQFDAITLAHRYKGVEEYIMSHVEYDLDYDNYSKNLLKWYETYKDNNIVKLADGLINIKKRESGEGVFLLKECRFPPRSFSADIFNHLINAGLSISNLPIEKVRQSRFRLSEDIDFFWRGTGVNGGDKCGVLFKENALLVDEELTLQEILLLESISKNSGEIEGCKLEENLCSSSQNKFTEANFLQSMLNLIKAGAVLLI